MYRAESRCTTGRGTAGSARTIARSRRVKAARRARRLLLHPRFGPRQVEQVADVADALDLARLPDEVADHLRCLCLAAQVDDAVLGVHVDVSLRDVGAAEDRRLHLARERDVVEVLRLLAQVRRLLREAVDLGAHPAARTPAAADRATGHAARPGEKLMP